MLRYRLSPKPQVIGLQNKLLDPRRFVLLYGTTPPRRGTSDDAVQTVAEKLAARLRDVPVDGIVVYDMQDESRRTQVRGADIVVTVTNSRDPVVRGEWLALGVHVNAVGASAGMGRELDTAAIARALLVVDSRDAAESESADYLEARRDRAIGPDHIRAELGELLAGLETGAGGPGRDRAVSLARASRSRIWRAPRTCVEGASRNGRGSWAAF